VAGRGRAFCAGNDIAEMATLTGDEAEALATRQAALLARFADLPQVTIAAIDGWALGGGLMLAVAQDLRVASDRARFGLPEVTLGFNPAYGIAPLLDVVAGGWACELLLTGRTIHASEALRMGLVNRVVAPPTLEASVAALAADIARAPRTGLAATKEIVAAIRRGERACGPGAHGAALHTRRHDVGRAGSRVGEEDRELVAPVACDEVGGARRLDERVGHGAQDVVADAVAEAVVDRPQLDHVEHEHERAGAPPAGHSGEA